MRGRTSTRRRTRRAPPPGLHDSAIYGQLFELGTGGTVVRDLATGYSFSPDAKTVTITIRQGVKFTDGTPFNAQAVCYNWERDLGPVAI